MGYGEDARRRNQYFTEDLTIGNIVHSYPHGPIHQVVITEKYGLWEHGDTLKDPTNYLRRWDEVKGSWRLETVQHRTLDTKDGDIMEKYAKFNEERWQLRYILDEVYRRFFIFGQKIWFKYCGHFQRCNLP